MSGQAMVTIDSKQWTTAVASTVAELQAGLSGLESMAAGTGMLFDLGYDYQTIQIDMTRMLFPLDIVFINSSRGVVGVMHDVQPGWTDVRLENQQLPGARWFLEVNAGEAEGINIGDDVVVQGDIRPAQLDLRNLLNLAVALMMVAFMGKMALRTLEPPKAKPELHGPSGERLLPQTSTLPQSTLTRKWYDRGVEVGKTDGWMTVEDTLSETLEQHPEIKEVHDLVWTDIDLWMETDHFSILYGSKMWEDARGAADLYSDLESEFWEGYLAGRKAVGV